MDLKTKIVSYNQKMLDFICIITIFLELFACAFCTIKLIELEKKVYKLNDKLNIQGEKILIFCQNTRQAIKKVNRVIGFITNKKFIRIKKVILLAFDLIQIIMLIKSLDFSKGLKSLNYKTLKKLLFAQVSKEVIRKILTQFATCA